MIEVLSALSVTTGLANGHDPETTPRILAVADLLARQSGASPADHADALFTSLLRYIGCTAYSHEEARASGGDEIAFRREFATVDVRKPGEVLLNTFQFALQSGSLAGFAAAFRLLLGGDAFHRGFVAANCEVGSRLARRLGMSAGVTTALAQLHERWDGRGGPAGLREQAIHAAARLVQVAGGAVVMHQIGGIAGVRELFRKGRGRIFDPRLVDVLLQAESGLRALLESDAIQDETHTAAIYRAMQPRPARAGWSLDSLAEVFGDFGDLASVHTAGHSRHVAELCSGAAAALGCSADERACLRRAALLHDLGIVAIPAAVREKPVRFSAGDWEQMRLHPYRTERILSAAAPLQREAAIAGRHHERADGSGYFRGEKRAATPLLARVLAAAEAYQSMCETRAHRSAFAPERAAAILRAETREGLWDGRAVEAVLAVAGHHARSRQSAGWPAGLSDREVQVLRLVATGHSNKAIGSQLGISHRTAQHHVIHIYDKIGVATRAAAALFASEQGLI